MAGAQEILNGIVQSRAGGRVERCHGIPKHGGYSNAAHSWGVAMIMHYLWPEDFPRLSLYCLSHDVPEAWFGDIPAPVGRYMPDVKARLAQLEGDLNRSIGLPGEDELTGLDRQKLKTCDQLELYLWCREQLGMGNHFAGEILKEITRYLEEQDLPEPAGSFFKEVQASHIMPVQAGVVRESQE